MSAAMQEERQDALLDEARNTFFEMARPESLFGGRLTLPTASSLEGLLTAAMLKRLKASEEVVVFTVHMKTGSTAYYVYLGA